MLSRKWVDFFSFHFAVVPSSTIMILAAFVKKKGNDCILSTVCKNIKFSNLMTEVNEGVMCSCVLLAERVLKSGPNCHFSVGCYKLRILSCCSNYYLIFICADYFCLT